MLLRDRRDSTALAEPQRTEGPFLQGVGQEEKPGRATFGKSLFPGMPSAALGSGCWRFQLVLRVAHRKGLDRGRTTAASGQNRSLPLVEV